MSPRRFDDRFKKRYVLRSTLLFVPALAAFVVLWRDGGRFGTSFWLATGFFVAWLVIWIIVDLWVFRAYCCPSCRRRLGPPTIRNRAAGDPIRYCCPQCDTEWDTGLRESGD